MSVQKRSIVEPSVLRSRVNAVEADDIRLDGFDYVTAFTLADIALGGPGGDDDYSDDELEVAADWFSDCGETNCERLIRNAARFDKAWWPLSTVGEE